MKKQGFDFTIEFVGVKETEEWANDDYTRPIQDAINETPFPIIEVGVYEDSGNFVLRGQIIRDTKKEAEAEYTLFKARMKKVLKNYGLKESIDRLKAYFTKPF